MAEHAAGAGAAGSDGAGLSLATAHEAVAAVVPDRECLVWRDRRLTWAAVTDRSRRVGAVLRRAGLGCFAPRDELAGWERGQDTVALFLFNGNEYLEVMLGAYKARVAPVNVNFRYTATELAYVLVDSGASAVVVHSSLAATLAEALPSCPSVRLVLQVDETPGASLPSGWQRYEDALAAADPEPPDAGCSPDDLYVLYTGGTTGRPKGVLWRQADFIAGALGVRATDERELAEAAPKGERLRVLPAPPFMHGAAHWNAWSAWLAGGTVVVQSEVQHVDPADVLTTAERERVTSLQVVGDPFARPLVDELRRHRYDLSTLRHLTSGGAVLSAAVKAELLDLLPSVTILDIMGSSETGRQGVRSSTADTGATTGTFGPSEGATVLDEERTRELLPGSPEVGWLATRGRVPLGYLNDRRKTEATFPVVDGVRYSVAGDRARRLADGAIELLGRDSVTINTGGEKVYAEEVEQAVKHHPAVFDALVVGRPSDRWGQEVVAVVELRPGAELTLEELRASCATTLARYKLPRALVVREHIARSPSGKPNYAWARQQAGAPRPPDGPAG